MEYMALILLLVTIILNIVLIFALFKKNSAKSEEYSELKADIANQLGIFTNTFSSVQKQNSDLQSERISELTRQLTDGQNTLLRTVNETLRNFDERYINSQSATDKKLEAIRETVEVRLKELQADNNAKLDKMRDTVDEKLQKTLESRIGESFKIVSERLEQVYKSLGEMQSLASGVGDLKKVLSNVKTRGVLGEIQLGAILEDILTKDQYVKNAATKKGSSNFVEYAVKLPGDEQGPVFLPIDAKFPADAYTNLLDAYDKGDPELVLECSKVLDTRIKGFAKDIKEKYIYPPDTTDFGIMFLPTEGLYSEVVKRGLFEKVQHDYNVIIAGPTTMAALLNSLQMGFKTLAIQKSSGEVWKVLQAVKTEFDKFGKALETAQNKINSVSDDIDNLIGTRTRQIQRKLKGVSELSDIEAIKILEDGED